MNKLLLLILFLPSLVLADARIGQYVNNRTVTAASVSYKASDEVVLANATSNAIAYLLPTAVGNSGKVVTIRKTDNSANAVTVTAFGAQTINGSTTYVLTAKAPYVTIFSDNANWHIKERALGADGVTLTQTGALLGKVAANVVTSASNSGNFGTASTTPVDVTNATVTITTTGRPVVLLLRSVGAIDCQAGAVYFGSSVGMNLGWQLSFMRDVSTEVSRYQPVVIGASSTNSQYLGAGSAYMAIDAPTAGSHTYKVIFNKTSGTIGTAYVNYCYLTAYEL